LALAVVIAIGVYARVQTTPPPDVAHKPPPEPKPPVLKEATIIVWGSKKGTYTLSYKGVSSGPLAWDREYAVGKNRVTETLGDDPKWFHMDFSESDRPVQYFDVELWKTEDWVGTLQMMVRANGKLVWCDDTDETETQLSHLGDFYYPEDLKHAKWHPVTNFFCRVSLWAA
jgi:hypothetical protein